MQTILQIIEQAGGYYSGLFLKIENLPYMNFDRREHPGETLDRMHTNDSMAKGLCPADVGAGTAYTDSSLHSGASD
jgi:hypothetical protein